MSARFCPECGARTQPATKFCAECGTALGGPPPPGAGWQFTAAGAGALGFFLAAGLAIWTVILSPPPPPAGPGGTAPRAGAGASSAALPSDHPPIIELPREVKGFIAELRRNADETPDDAASWVRLGLVTARASQLDPEYRDDAFAALDRALELDPKSTAALRAAANLHYDRRDHVKAIPLFERYLAIAPDDSAVQTDLATMHFHAGDARRAIATYRDVIRRDPSFLQAHYNLAITHHREGDTDAALAELQVARSLAPDDGVRQQIDEVIASVGGAPIPAVAPSGNGAADPFQRAVEEAMRAHEIMGPRIVRFEWATPASGRVLMQNFPMAAMPPAVREKFLGRLATILDTAAEAHTPAGTPRVDVVDLGSGTVMATVPP